MRDAIGLTRKQLDAVATEIEHHPQTTHAILVADSLDGSNVRLRLLGRAGRKSIRDVWLGPRGRVEPIRRDS